MAPSANMGMCPRVRFTRILAVPTGQTISDGPLGNHPAIGTGKRVKMEFFFKFSLNFLKVIPKSAGISGGRRVGGTM